MTPPTKQLREKLARVDRAARAVSELALAGDFAADRLGCSADTAEILWGRLRALDAALVDIQLDVLTHIALSVDEDELYWAGLRAKQARLAPLGARVVPFPERRAA